MSDKRDKLTNKKGNVTNIIEDGFSGIVRIREVLEEQHEQSDPSVQKKPPNDKEPSNDSQQRDGR